MVYECFDAWTEVCDEDILKQAMNIPFFTSLRIGELIGLTWECVDISEEAIEESPAGIHITKKYRRVSKEAVEVLDGKDIIIVPPLLRVNSTKLKQL